MANDDQFGRYANIPIPSYDEATSSRPGSSAQQHRGPQEISDDAERQGLLEDGTTPLTQYRRPTVESDRSSVDSDLRLPEVGGANDEARRHVEELDYLDPLDTSRRSPRPYHRAQFRNLSSRFSKFSATLSSIRLPSFRSFYTPVASGNASEAPAPSRSTWLTRMSQRFPTIPEQYRMSAPTAARLCGLASLIILVYVLFTMDIFSGNTRRMGGRIDPEAVRAFVQENVDSERIAEYLMHITSYDHVAGTEGDLYMAEWMRETWTRDGAFDDIALLSYYVYLNYPTPDGRSVSIIEPEDKRWTAMLEEGLIDPAKQQTLAWHGHSRNGDVKGHLVYANGGSREDFQFLKQQGVVLEGSIALMRYYSSQGDRALKIKAAEEAGCIGALIYSDPSDDGSGRGAVWPEGPWRTADSLQRGGVSLMSWIVGDPLTPGYASTPDAKTIPTEGNPGLVNIPSLPLSWRDAKVLISSLKGHGVWVPEDWVGGSPEFEKRWFSGNASSGSDQDVTIVHLTNQNEENTKQQIWNLHGLFKGAESPEKKIIVGSHRDAWCFGSVDPGSGNAVMMELATIFGRLRKVGWRPLRTIEFASWDAEEYNLVGSTEYVEDNMDYLRTNGVAYINVDVGVSGLDAIFRAAASPVWNRPLMNALSRVSDPNTEKSLRETWETRNTVLEGLGAGSDYVAFQDMAGVSSIDFGFEGAKHAFPYHSCYETFEWMNKFGDPGFNYARALAQVWALLILEMADRPLLPYDLRDYAGALGSVYLGNLHAYASSQMDKYGLIENVDELLKPLRDAAEQFTERAEKFHLFEETWSRNVYGAGGIESQKWGVKRLSFNDALSNFERDLLDLPVGPTDKDQHGVKGREQFKHIVFGPQAWSGYDVGYFPMIRDALAVGNWTEAQKMADKAAMILNRAVDKIPSLG